jgi:hypothetical protein
MGATDGCVAGIVGNVVGREGAADSLGRVVSLCGDDSPGDIDTRGATVAAGAATAGSA